jgi:putative permease
MVDDASRSSPGDASTATVQRAPVALERSPMQRALPIYYALLLGILTVGGLMLAVQLRHVLVLLFVSVIFAAAVSAPAAHLERHGLPRSLAVLIVYLVAVGAVLAGGWFVVPPLLHDIGRLAHDAPLLVGRVDALRDKYAPLQREYPGLASLDRQLVDFSQRILVAVGGRLDRLPESLFGFLFVDLFSVIILSLMMVFARERMLATILSLTPPRHQAETARVLGEMWQRVGLYLRARGMTMIVVGAMTWAALALLHVPYPLLLGVIGGAGEAIPLFGVWLARVPILAIAATHGLTTMGLALAASLLIELIKGHAISPVIEGRQLHVHPMVTIIAGLVGAALLGFAGAFIALPAAALIQVLFDEVFVPWRRAQIGLDPHPGGDAALAAPAPPRRWSFLRRA